MAVAGVVGNPIAVVEAGLAGQRGSAGSEAQGFESIGRVAGGVAHEIATPIQFVLHNVEFLQQAFAAICTLLDQGQALASVARRLDGSAEAAARFDTQARRLRLDTLRDEIPAALAQSIEGLSRVAKIARALEELSRPDAGDGGSVDVNLTIESVLTVARAEWKYVADAVTDLDPQLPHVPCSPARLRQVVLDLVVNAAQGIADRAAAGGPARGTITLRTRREGQAIVISVEGTGSGGSGRVRLPLAA